jgi:uncharacterized protein with GYD domain
MTALVDGPVAGEVPARAHLLLQVDPGRAGEAAAFLAGLPGVVEAVATSGPYDVVAVVEAAGEPGVQRAVARARRTPGLAVLRTCRGG